MTKPKVSAHAIKVPKQKNSLPTMGAYFPTLDPETKRVAALVVVGMIGYDQVATLEVLQALGLDSDDQV